MLFKILLFLLTISPLFSQIVLSEIYEINSSKIYLNDIISNSSIEKLLYTIDPNKHSKRVKSADLKKILQELGFKHISSSSRYIKFQIKSPIDTRVIKTFLKQHYLSKYKTLSIQNIHVYTHSFIKKLPKNYKIEIRRKSHLSHIGMIDIKDEHNKKLFFNYTIQASVKVLQTTKKIKRNEKLSFINTRYKTITFDKFRAIPIMVLINNTLQAKHQIKNFKTITVNDVETLDFVHKNSQVSVSLNNNGIYITFTAKALQNGKLGDIITIQKQDLTRLKAKVVGKKKVELR